METARSTEAGSGGDGLMQAVRNTETPWSTHEALSTFAPGLTEADEASARLLPRALLALALVGAVWGACALAWPAGAVQADAQWQAGAARHCDVDCTWQVVADAR
jgi:hypothetical protein